MKKKIKQCCSRLSFLGNYSFYKEFCKGILKGQPKASKETELNKRTKKPRKQTGKVQENVAGSLMQNIKLLSFNLYIASVKCILKTADCPQIIFSFYCPSQK